MMGLLYYIFSRLYRFYTKRDKDIRYIAPIGIITVSTWFIILSISILLFPNKLNFILSIKDNSKITIALILIIILIIWWFIFIKIEMLNDRYNDIIDTYESKNKHHNVYFYGYFACILLFFIISMILSRIIYY